MKKSVLQIIGIMFSVFYAHPARAALVQWNLVDVYEVSDPATTLNGFFIYDTNADMKPGTQHIIDFSFNYGQNPNSFLTSMVTQGHGIGSFYYTADPASNHFSASGAGGYIDLEVGLANFDQPLNTKLSLVGPGATSALGFNGPYQVPLAGSLIETAVTPLPDALPMFGAALLGLMGFGAYKLRRASA